MRCQNLVVDPRRNDWSGCLKQQRNRGLAKDSRTQALGSKEEAKISRKRIAPFSILNA